MSTVDFLIPDAEDIRHQITNILESYSHEWDLLSELAQNSVDSIRELDPEKGDVEINFDVPKRTITISDNGCGVDANKIKKLLRPFGTNKRGHGKQVGEKGVGLKFVIFSSSEFLISSVGPNGPCTASIVGASAWLGSDSGDALQLSENNESSINGRGTTVRVRVSDPNHPLFDYSFEELIFLLRTKTALGDLGFIWGENIKCETKVSYTDRAGKLSTRHFDCKYLLPTEGLKPTSIEKLEDFEEWIKAAPDRTDLQKYTRLRNKILWTANRVTKGSRDLRVWSCFVPSRDFWVKLTEAAVHDAAPSKNEDEEQTLGRAGIGFSGGLETGTKGMPTSIRIALEGRGEAGYLPNFFMIVDDPSLNFDIGRKSIHGRQQGVLKDLAYRQFREFLKWRKYLGGDISPENPAWDKDEAFAQISQLPDLDSKKSRFKKRPNAQEATIAAMFFESIGAGRFPELTPLVSGYKDRYDFYANWGNRRVIIDFKYDLSGLLRDISVKTKDFSEITAIVLWEVTEQDRAIAAKRGYTIQAIEKNPLVQDTIFPHATHLLAIGDAKPISIVQMKTLLDAN
jgi:molecular chaperone HtpG